MEMSRMSTERPSFEPGRRYRYVAQIFVSTVAFAVILVLANYLAATRRVCAITEASRPARVNCKPSRSCFQAP